MLDPQDCMLNKSPMVLAMPQAVPESPTMIRNVAASGGVIRY
jgi:hypothetical protein